MPPAIPTAPRRASMPTRWAGNGRQHPRHRRTARDRYGVRAVIHPHAGGYIEFEDELDRIANDVPSETGRALPRHRPSGLCRDGPGRDDFAGTPTARDYIHFKDIDAAKYADVMGRRIRFFDACAEGVMCPIGRGRIDYASAEAAAHRDRLRRLHHHRAGARSAQLRGHPRGPRREPGLSAAHRLLTGKMAHEDARRHHHRPVVGRSLRRPDRRPAGGHGLVLEVHRRLADQHRLRHGPAGAEVRGRSPASATSIWAASSSSSSPAKAWTPAA